MIDNPYFCRPYRVESFLGRVPRAAQSKTAHPGLWSSAPSVPFCPDLLFLHILQYLTKSLFHNLRFLCSILYKRYCFRRNMGYLWIFLTNFVKKSLRHDLFSNFIVEKKARSQISSVPIRKNSGYCKYHVLQQPL